MKYFEDIAVGERIAVGSHTFRADEIKTFATNFDPQPIHLDAVHEESTGETCDGDGRLQSRGASGHYREVN